jgi:Ca-activated chloride channel homolog
MESKSSPSAIKLIFLVILYAWSGEAFSAPGGNLTGYFVDSKTSRSISNVKVALSGNSNMIETISDTCGYFEFLELEAGQYKLGIEKNAYVQPRPEDVLVLKGDNKSLGKIAMEKSVEYGEISGSVIDSLSLKALVNAYVLVLGIQPNKGAVTDFDGNFIVYKVPAGKYEVEISAAGYRTIRIPDVSVLNGMNAQLGKIDLTSNGTISNEITFVVDSKPIRVEKASCVISRSAVDFEEITIHNVADIVKSMPGFKVDDKGAIHARGGHPDVGRFLIAGKDSRDPYITPERSGRIFAPESNTEEYARIIESNWQDVLSYPTSTFAADVDEASYTNLRRILNNRQLPLPDAVRLEECVNYFDYDYPQPDGKHPMCADLELAACPWNLNHLLLQIGVKGKTKNEDEMPPCNLVFLIDVSGSMKAKNKLPLLKQSFEILVKELRTEDRVAIVVYAGQAGLVLDSTPGNKKDLIMSRILNLHPGGSTAGGAGIKLAYKIAAENFLKIGTNRIILATDGDFNLGISSTSELVRYLEDQRETNIFLTVLGVGTGNLKDHRMQELADRGNGQHIYIDSIIEARKVFRYELLASLHTIAKDVKFQLEFNPAEVSEYRLIGYENRRLKKEDFVDDRKDAGEIGSGHTVTALYEIVLADGETRQSNKLKYQDTAIKRTAFNSQELLTLSIRYKKPKGKKSQLIEYVLQDKNTNLEQASENMRFASAVAAFGLVLRESEYAGSASYPMIRKLAKNSIGADPYGRRAEFLSLVSVAEELSRD